jgi:two-component system chemotaxis sensor kinase CheA
LDGAERAREDFLSEAQEIVEALGRDMLALDEARRAGLDEPELVNDLFRGVHTLKGLAGLFGATTLAMLSHELESLLDALRLGKVALDEGSLDVLFRAVERYGRILVAERDGAEPPEVDDLLAMLSERLGRMAEAGDLNDFALDPGLLAVLTEYEEHRLRTNVAHGASLFRLHIELSLTTLDRELEQLKALAKPFGEIITYLPAGAGSSPDSLELDVLMASHVGLDALTAGLGPHAARAEEVARREGREATSPPLAAPRAAPFTVLPAAPMILDEAKPSLHPARAGGGAVETSLRSVAKTVRVDITKLDQLMNVVGELAIVRSSLGRLSDRLRAARLERSLLQDIARLQRDFDRRLEALQNGILEVRMVPLGQMFDRLARVVRQISRDLDRPVNLVISGAETELDKLLVEELSDPLMHIMRNAIDHGIESAPERERVGKPVMGTVALNAFQKGSHVVLEIEDDGRGIDTEQLLISAVRMGLIGPEEAAQTSVEDALSLVFTPGLSTRDEVSEVSGRGVGMDVVKTNIAKLGGVIDLSSEPGIGTKLTITLPITLAIIGALLLEVSGQLFALPLSSVEEIVSLTRAPLSVVDGVEMLTLRGRSLRLVSLERLFGLERAASAEAGRRAFAVVVSAGSTRLGLAVDALVGQQDVVIKALGRSLSKVRGFAGATELGDQRIALVLDAPALVEEVFGAGAGGRELRLARGSS